MKDMLGMLIEVAMVLVIMLMCGAAVYALSGCTAAGASREQEAAMQKKGFYCHAEEAKTVTSAFGEAAVAAAKYESFRAIKAEGKSK